jgi:hypothetical protein
MDKTTSPSKSAIQYGVLFGIAMILELVISYVLKLGAENKSYGIIISFLNYLVLPAVFTYLAVTNYKKNHNEGFLSLGESIKIGMTVALIGSILYGVFYFIFTMIFPEFIPEVLEQTRSITIQQNPNMTDDQLDMTMSIMKKMMNPYIMVPVTIVIYCFVYLIHSLIIGAVTKRERPQSFN